MLYEVEQKYRLKDPGEVETALVALGVSFSSPVEQSDRYFNHPSRDFAETDEAFRIRSVGHDNRVTYKGPKIDQTTKTRQELELPLGDGDDVARGFVRLFELLDFEFVREVRKSRRTGSIDWHGTEVEVVLDEVYDLGSFLELEQTVDEESVEDARKRLAEIAEHLGLDGVERRSYLELLLEQ